MLVLNPALGVLNYTHEKYPEAGRVGNVSRKCIRFVPAKG
jgi:hypothetical protein